MLEINPLIEKAFKGIRDKHYPKGQIILFQGDEPVTAFLLQTGIIKVYDIDDQGNEKILHLLKPSAVLPFALYSGISNPIQWFYSALTDCDVCEIPADDLKKQMHASNELTLQLMNWFSTEMHELLVRVSSLGKTNTRDKLVAALTFLGVHHAVQRPSGWWRVTFPVNHQLLADMTGMTRESAAMTMKTLKDERLIRQPRLTILEINLDKLLA